jgi:hypothetical protein
LAGLASGAPGGGLRNYGEIALIGRDPERVILRETLETSHRSGGSTLVLRGTVGIGKSALLRLAEAEARQRECRCSR